jgi:hypothetical protein
MSARRARRPVLCWLRRLLRLAAAARRLARRLARRRRGPLVDGLGLPTARHPENVAAELPERDEEWLASAAAELWPEDEYAEIVRAYHPGGDQS